MFIPEDDRGTLCISSQAGCAVDCRFCSTGHQGFSRNLTTGEIVGQLWLAEHHLRQRLDARRRASAPITNVVMMGMGEPLQNYDDAACRRCGLMLDDHGYGLSRRRVTVSTSGVVPMIDRLRDDCPVALAVSLHAPNDALRDDLVPLNRKYPIAELLAACRRYLERAPRDFITFEYCMLDGVNDAPEHARELVRLVREAGVPCKFNLIPFNPFPDSGLRRSPQRARARRSPTCCSDAGIVTTVRKTRGDDIDAACGQLAGEVQDRTRVAPSACARGRSAAGAAPSRRARRRSAELDDGDVRVASGRCAGAARGGWPRCWRCARRTRGGAGDATRDRVTDVRRDRRRPARPRAASSSPSATSAAARSTTALDEVKLALAADPTCAEAYNLRGLIYAQPRRRPRWPRTASSARCSSTRATPTRCTTTAGSCASSSATPRPTRMFDAGARRCRTTATRRARLLAQGVCQARAGQLRRGRSAR